MSDTSPKQFQVFLSHNSDEKQQVLAIAKHLKDEGITYWIDTERLRSRGTIDDQVGEAIHQCESLAFFIGGKGLGTYHGEEGTYALQLARNHEMEIIPVLLPGGSADQFPWQMRSRLWVDFRADVEDPQALNRLITYIQDGGTNDMPAVEQAHGGRPAMADVCPPKTKPTDVASYCDRVLQEDMFVESLPNHAPRIYFVEGTKNQLHAHFLKRLADHTLPIHLDLDRSRVRRKEAHLPPTYGNSATFRHKYERSVGKALDLSPQESRPEQIKDAIHKHRGRRIIYSDLSEQKYAKLGRQSLNALVEFWADWLKVPGSDKLIVFLCLHYEPPQHTLSFKRFMRVLKGNALKRAFEELLTKNTYDIELVRLPELAGVTDEDVCEWGEQFCEQLEVELQLPDVCEEWSNEQFDPVPMDKVIAGLKKLMQRKGVTN